MFIRVNSSQGIEYIANVSGLSTVIQLKSRLSEMANGVPIDRQTLIYKGRTMQDSEPLSVHNLEDNCEIQLIARQVPSAGAALSPSNNCPMSMSPSSHRETSNSLSAFEILLRRKLGTHFASSEIEKIIASLRYEIDADINSSSLDDLERLAKQKLNISNE